MKSVPNFHFVVLTVAFVLGGVCYHIVVHFAGTAYPHASWYALAVVALFLVLSTVAFKLGRGSQSKVVVSSLLLAWFLSFLAGSIIGSVLFKVPAVGRGYQKRSVANIYQVGQSLEEYRSHFGRYPSVENVKEMPRVLSDDLPQTDGWGFPLLVESSPEEWIIVGYGKFGKPDSPPNDPRGASPGLEADIILSSTGWQQYPEGMEVPPFESVTE